MIQIFINIRQYLFFSFTPNIINALTADLRINYFYIRIQTYLGASGEENKGSLQNIVNIYVIDIRTTGIYCILVILSY